MLQPLLQQFAVIQSGLPLPLCCGILLASPLYFSQLLYSSNPGRIMRSSLHSFAQLLLACQCWVSQFLDLCFQLVECSHQQNRNCAARHSRSVRHIQPAHPKLETYSLKLLIQLVTRTDTHQLCHAIASHESSPCSAFAIELYEGEQKTIRGFPTAIFESLQRRCTQIDQRKVAGPTVF